MEQAGSASPWLFLIVGISIISIVLTFGRLSSFFTDSGGPVLYTKEAFGPLVGFSTGWILYISRATAFAANSNALALYLALSFHGLAGPGKITLITSTCLLLTWINYIGVKRWHKNASIFYCNQIVAGIDTHNHGLAIHPY